MLWKKQCTIKIKRCDCTETKSTKRENEIGRRINNNNDNSLQFEQTWIAETLHKLPMTLNSYSEMRLLAKVERQISTLVLLPSIRLRFSSNWSKWFFASLLFIKFIVYVSHCDQWSWLMSGEREKKSWRAVAAAIIAHCTLSYVQVCRDCTAKMYIAANKLTLGLRQTETNSSSQTHKHTCSS